MAKRINNSITISANVPVRTLASIHLHLKKKYGVVEKSKSGLIRKCVEAVAETISKEDSFEGTQDAFDYLQKEFGGFAVHRHGILKDVDMEEALEKKFIHLKKFMKYLRILTWQVFSKTWRGLRKEKSL